ncbi:MAG: S-ribosylhomocysteine lyase [Oscillospiraceae bacterium]|nr:S-ribosylhomocysteine lyase [Oscillospiraceae bacterium]
MKQIASFCIDHDTLGKGLYTSRIDGDVVTYDLRMVVPNAGIYLDNAGIHTFEHLFATYVRNSAYSDQVVYVGPMGCRTGFYFLVRDSLSPAEVILLTQETMDFIAGFEGPVPGAQRSCECGNYLNHDLAAARAYARDMAAVLRGWTPAMLDYDYDK